MKRERLEYFAIEYFIYWNSMLPKFPLEIVNVLPSDVRYVLFSIGKVINMIPLSPKDYSNSFNQKM